MVAPKTLIRPLLAGFLFAAILYAVAAQFEPDVNSAQGRAAAERVAGVFPCLARHMENLCYREFVSQPYPHGLLSDWQNPANPSVWDSTPLASYTDHHALSESASMFALYTALIGDKGAFDKVYTVSAPPMLGGTGHPGSLTEEAPYYFASPNLGLLHWILDENGYKDDSGTGVYANAPGEENRWLEALYWANRNFPDLKYELFANSLAWGLMGATDFDEDAIGNFEDPGTPEEFDDYLMRYTFDWRDDFNNGYSTALFTNLSYNNLLGWHYAAQLGREPREIHRTTTGGGGVEVIEIPLQAIKSIRLDLTERGTEWGYSLWEVEMYSPYTDTNVVLGNATAKASSEQNDFWCHECFASKAIDGDLTTRWSSQQPISGVVPPQWLTITLTDTYRINRIVLRWGRAYASAYHATVAWPFADFYTKVLTYTVAAIKGNDTLDLEGSQQGALGGLYKVMYDINDHFYYGEVLAGDLAAGKVVTASSVQAPIYYWPEYAVDGDPCTRWSSDWSDPQWIAVDLGDVYTVNRVRLEWEAAYGQVYTIQVSADGNSWTTVHSTTTGAGGVEVINFPSTQAQYVRMYGTQRATQWGYSFWTFEVYGPDTGNTDLALHKTVTASSVQEDPRGYLPEFAVDKNPCTRWSSDWSDPQWIAVDLGSMQPLDGVVLNWETAYGKAYTIEVSDDGLSWTTIFTETAGNGSRDEIRFPQTSARYVRMYGTERGTQWGYSLRGFEVYKGGCSSLTALDLARRAGVYAHLVGDDDLAAMGRRTLDWFMEEYNHRGKICGAYDIDTGAVLPGQDWEGIAIYADLVELALEYGEYGFAQRVIQEQLWPHQVRDDPDNPLFGAFVGLNGEASAFHNLEALIALHRFSRSGLCVYLPLVVKDRP